MRNDNRNHDVPTSSEEVHAAAVARHRQLPMMPQGILDALLASSVASAVIVITDEDGNKVAPAFQLDSRLRLRRSVFYVNMVTVAPNHPHDMLHWWTQPHSHLEDGKSPRNLLGTAEERRVMELIDLMENTDGTSDVAVTELINRRTKISNDRYDRYMMRPTDAEILAIHEERRQQQLARQEALLAQVDMLSVADTIKVLRDAPEHIIVLVDPRAATIKVPAFQFIRDNSGELVPNPQIQAVHSAKGIAIGFPNFNVNGAWDTIDWWYNHTMKLDASDPTETKFTPISIAGDNAKLNLLIDWVKDWGNEVSYG